MNVCACLCVDMHVCVYVHAGQRTTSGVILRNTIYALRQGLSLAFPGWPMNPKDPPERILPPSTGMANVNWLFLHSFRD